MQYGAGAGGLPSDNLLFKSLILLMGLGSKPLAYSPLKQIQEGVLWNESIFYLQDLSLSALWTCGPGLGSDLSGTEAVLLITGSPWSLRCPPVA